jgi:hypothetical protein
LKRIKASKTPEVEANFNSEKSARSGATPFAKFTIPGEKKNGLTPTTDKTYAISRYLKYLRERKSRAGL